ncbi:DNA repair protein rhp57 [Clarireedia jacksonii]
MTDLSTVLPTFLTHQYVRLIPSLEKNLITTADLITLDCVEIAKRARLPVPDVKRLCTDVLKALKEDLGVAEKDGGDGQQQNARGLRKSGKELLDQWDTISTLDDDLDRALGGGIPAGYITEITGESGAGKTQFLLTLLLSAQLPSPQGLGTPTLYISTESALPTQRVAQLLRTHPILSSHPQPPTFDKIHSIVTPDLESQDHILRFQVPVVIQRYGIRLLILDSVAANYRAEFERDVNGTTNVKKGMNMAHRSAELVKLGQLLRNLAREHGIAVVVANQVADRFSSPGSTWPMAHGARSYSTGRNTSGGANLMPPNSATASGVNTPIPGSPVNINTSVPAPRPRPDPNPYAPFQTPDPMSLDHQQRWITGWGDDPNPSFTTTKSLKTPSLGLIWTTQIACRIALIKKPVYGRPQVLDEEGERGEPVLKRWRRWMKVVFAGWAPESGGGLAGAVEFEIVGEGVRAVGRGGGGNEGEDG